MFYSQKKKYAQPVDEYNRSKENCRRQIILKAVGDEMNSNDATSKDYCCDVCTEDKVDPQLDVLKPGKTTAKRRKAVRVIDEEAQGELRHRLIEARSTVIAENPTLRMLGYSLVCPEVTINELCNQAKFINKEDDLSVLFGIKTVFRKKFYEIIMDVVSSLPQTKRRRLNNN